MTNFIDRHLPKTINDLVFHDPQVEQTIREYATGQRTKHLLLYGPTGSGKSEAARMLVDTLCPNTAGSPANERINPKNFAGKDMGFIERTWFMQMGFGGAARGWIVIDEVDWFAANKMHELRGFIDDTKLGSIICTTNHLHALDDPLKGRFKKLHVEWPTVEDWLPRAKAILAAEGHHLSDLQMRSLLQGFAGSARDLLEWLENYVLALRQSLGNGLGGAPCLNLIAGARLSNPSLPKQAVPTLTLAV